MSNLEDLHERFLKRLLKEEPEDEATEEGEAAEEEEVEEAEDDEKSSDPKGSFEQSLDSELEAIFIDFETGAREAVVQESKSLRVLYEDSDIDEINIPDFAANVARLVKNYENLLDMEDILVSRAGEFLEDRYGPDAKTKLEDELVTVHDIEIEDPKSLGGEIEVPLALGARSSEG